MNDKEKQENGTYRLAEGALTHGLNDLHFKLHCFDMLLNLSYKSVLPKKQRQNRGVENKNAVAARKVIIQDRFKEKLNLLIESIRLTSQNRVEERQIQATPRDVLLRIQNCYLRYWRWTWN